ARIRGNLCLNSSTISAREYRSRTTSPPCSCVAPSRAQAQEGSTESSRNIGLGSFVLRRGEDDLGFAELHQVAGPVVVYHEEGRVVGNPRCLVHVVGNDDDCVLVLQLE